jgi:hypothetical protein
MWNFVHWLPRYAITIIRRFIALLQLLCRWQHQSRKLWISAYLHFYIYKCIIHILILWWIFFYIIEGGLSQFHVKCIWCDNLILGLAAVANTIQAGELSRAMSCIQARVNMFQHAFTLQTKWVVCAQGGSSSCPWCAVGGKMSDKIWSSG